MKAKNTDYSRVRACARGHSPVAALCNIGPPRLAGFRYSPPPETLLGADPYASWQKGAVENTNKLIRQYIPKHTNFDEVTDKKIASIQKKINSRPRKKLKFETPKTEFFKRIA